MHLSLNNLLLLTFNPTDQKVLNIIKYLYPAVSLVQVDDDDYDNDEKFMSVKSMMTVSSQ